MYGSATPLRSLQGAVCRAASGEQDSTHGGSRDPPVLLWSASPPIADMSSPLCAPAGVMEATWREAIDPRTGRSYYYNPVTRETTWERPASLAAAEGGGGLSSATYGKAHHHSLYPLSHHTSMVFLEADDFPK
jgi:hypothetical protein